MRLGGRSFGRLYIAYMLVCRKDFEALLKPTLKHLIEKPKQLCPEVGDPAFYLLGDSSPQGKFNWLNSEFFVKPSSKFKV